ncbi:RagB/SusD family nutrient uptake outer membrane protein [Pedobacter sp. SD-b]|uniref:RagB/SusD family nutrient uptake outer membrane protein n=1 Tax=Pedobacter segetis TaxID=2793069 RepID=A0ABS1BJ38_9SPHI|nr:RagB/SusD family nutrient uptake outer membrane protein [Pedobacter segetis]MBK0382853.1 RagB/SusD family nutrient uptake outer membrane protein [Pedobacter segetis]
MRKNKIIYALLLLFSVTSCKKYLDKTDKVGLVEDDVFSTYESARGYLDQSYAALADIHDWNSQQLQRSNINCLSDEMASLITENNGIANVINTGNWLNQSNLGEIGDNRGNSFDNVRTTTAPVMENAYYILRVANKVIEKAPTIPNITNDQLNQLLGQAYFMRGWYYFQLILRVGGLPIYDKAFNPNDDLDLPRSTYQESNDFVIKNMDRAIQMLPDKWDPNQTGRATKVAAMAVKEMAELYAASPLMQNDLNSTVDKGYGLPQAEKAAQYANDVIKYCMKNTGGTNYRLSSGSKYSNIFYHFPNNASDEELWYRMDAGSRDQTRGLRCMYIPQYLSGGTGLDAAAFNGPTQNMVDKFEVINNGQAYQISDQRSGYNAQDPYKNRDPRFYSDIIYTGQQWGSNANNTPAYQELYVGGRDQLNASNNPNTKNRMISGYECKKFVWEGCNTFKNQYNNFRLNTCYIRLAQVYLDFAEAMNEAYGPNADPKGYGLTAEQAINIIRNRVGMPNVLPEYTASKEVFRDRIRNERAVELCFENQRWHDLRRWMIAEDVFKKPIQGIEATPPANHRSIIDKSTLQFTYRVIDLSTEVRVFDTKNYWYPVPQDQVNSQFNFKQNPGW